MKILFFFYFWMQKKVVEGKIRLEWCVGEQQHVYIHQKGRADLCVAQ